ncbi:MAG: hypothetical protein JW973_16950 [Bacteroidales bacterium]|nr:hypothetical protein [Bacteroidales bacterium]
MITVRKICFYMLVGMLLYNFTGCSAEKAMNERRNLMIPKRSELPRNSIYKEKPAKKTYKPKIKKKKKVKKLF